jgi:hypothetical protein
MDIPVVDDIPVVSKLGKKNKEMKKNKLEKLSENKSKTKDIIEAEDEDLETHFVENPFIKMREKSNMKISGGKMMKMKELMEDEEVDEDIVIMKETGKFIIKDTEEEKIKSIN